MLVVFIIPELGVTLSQFLLFLRKHLELFRSLDDEQRVLLNLSQWRLYLGQPNSQIALQQVLQPVGFELVDGLEKVFISLLGLLVRFDVHAQSVFVVGEFIGEEVVFPGAKLQHLRTQLFLERSVHDFSDSLLSGGNVWLTLLHVWSIAATIIANS